MSFFPGKDPALGDARANDPLEQVILQRSIIRSGRGQGRGAYTLACEAAWVLEDANGDGPDFRDGDLRKLSRRRPRSSRRSIRSLQVK